MPSCFRKVRQLNTIASLSLLLVGAPAIAAHGTTGVMPHHGPAGHAMQVPQASLRAQASQEVVQDRVAITLAAEISDDSQQAVTETLSDKLDQATQRAKSLADKAVTITTGSYRVWPMNDDDGKISNWRGRGEIVLESSDFEAASKLAAELDETLAIASLSFFVAPQTRAEKEEALLDDAVQVFNQRAKALTTSLGYSDYRIKDIDLGGSGAQYSAAPSADQSVGFKAASASVPLEGGTETISVSVQGSVYLLDETAENSQ